MPAAVQATGPAAARSSESANFADSSHVEKVIPSANAEPEKKCPALPPGRYGR
jgi:hypothetical protein